MSEDKKNTDVPEAQTQVPAPEGTTELTITDLNALFIRFEYLIDDVDTKIDNKYENYRRQIGSI